MALAGDLAAAFDPMRLMQRAGLTADPWQAALLRSRAPGILLNASRQSGKSTTTSALALWEALFIPNSLILMLAPALRQSQELFKKLASLYGAVDRPVAPEAETALTLTLANGSRVVSLPGTEATVRGYSGVRLLVVDEASRVPDELYYAIRPMLAVSGGRLVALSTPFGRRGWFYEEWENGGPAWERVRIPAAECPRISASFLEEERRSMPAFFYVQEFECVFSDTDDQIYATEDIRRAVDPDLQPLFAVAGGAW